MAADPLLALRSEFPILDKATYLISNSLGATPKAAGIDDRTALVAISHVLFKSAFVLDVPPIAEKCRRVAWRRFLDQPATVT